MYQQIVVAQTVDKLKEIRHEFLLEDYPAKDVLGLFFPTEVTSERPGMSSGTTKMVTIGIVVHGRLFPKKIMAYMVGETVAWVNANELEKLY